MRFCCLLFEAVEPGRFSSWCVRLTGAQHASRAYHASTPCRSRVGQGGLVTGAFLRQVAHIGRARQVLEHRARRSRRSHAHSGRTQATGGDNAAGFWEKENSNGMGDTFGDVQVSTISHRSLQPVTNSAEPGHDVEMNDA